MQKNYLYWLMPTTWMAIIFLSSSTPYENQDIKPILSNILDLSFLEPYVSWVSFQYHHSEVSVNSLGVNGLIEFFIRKGAHFGSFFILMFLFYFAIRKNVKWSLQKILVVSFLSTVAYAIIDEIHQGFTPNRTPYIGDVIIDSLGALTACLIILIWKRRKNSNLS